MDVILARLEGDQLRAHCLKAQRQELQDTELQLQRTVEALQRLREVQQVARRFEVEVDQDHEIRTRLANVGRLQKEIMVCADTIMGVEVLDKATICKKEEEEMNNPMMITPAKSRSSLGSTNEAISMMSLMSPVSTNANGNFVDLSLCESESDSSDEEENDQEPLVEEQEASAPLPAEPEVEEEDFSVTYDMDEVDEDPQAPEQTTAAIEADEVPAEQHESAPEPDFRSPSPPSSSSKKNRKKRRRTLSITSEDTNTTTSQDTVAPDVAPCPTVSSTSSLSLSFPTSLVLCAEFAKGLQKRRMAERIVGLDALVRKLRQTIERLLAYPVEKQPKAEYMDELHRITSFVVHVIIKGKAKKPREWLCELQHDLQQVQARCEDYAHVFFADISKLTKYIETNYMLPTKETEELKDRVRQELEELDRWSRGNVAASDFQDKMQLIKLVLETRYEGWDPRSDRMIESFLDTLVDRLEAFKPSQTKTKRTDVLLAWKAEMKVTSDDAMEPTEDTSFDMDVDHTVGYEPEPEPQEPAELSVAALAPASGGSRGPKAKKSNPMIMEKALLCLQATRCLQRTPTLSFLQEFHTTMASFGDLIEFLMTIEEAPTAVEWDVLSEAIDLLEHIARRVKSRERRHLRLFVERMKHLEGKYTELPLNIAVNTSKLMSAFPVRPDIYFKFKVYEED